MRGSRSSVDVARASRPGADITHNVEWQQHTRARRPCHLLKLDEALSLCAWGPGEVIVGYESSCYSFWFEELLAELGLAPEADDQAAIRRYAARRPEERCLGRGPDPGLAAKRGVSTCPSFECGDPGSPPVAALTKRVDNSAFAPPFILLLIIYSTWIAELMILC
ncbi:MAG TPA: hypothetical protein VN643_18420 [Pyrinomonadaceae bacterium]|nr:hypothetical protein [Pyrinomonadaceae bacterium]